MSLPVVLGKNLLVRKVERQETKQNGLIIPDSAIPSQHEFEVLGIGDEVKTINIGNKIVCAPYSGSIVTFNKINYLVMSIESVLAILPKE